MNILRWGTKLAVTFSVAALALSGKPAGAGHWEFQYHAAAGSSDATWNDRTPGPNGEANPGESHINWADFNGGRYGFFEFSGDRGVGVTTSAALRGMDGSDAGTAIVSGSVQAFFRWTHDGAHDDSLPPEQFVVRESWWVDAIGPPGATLATSFALGGSITPYNPDAESVGQRLSGAVSTLVNNPNREWEVSLPARTIFGKARIEGYHFPGYDPGEAIWDGNWRSVGTTGAYYVQPISVSIYRGYVDITGTTQNTKVGRKLNLFGMVQGAEDLTVGGSQWTIPGVIFSDWVANNVAAALYRVDDVLDRPGVSFCWVDGGTSGAPGTPTVEVTYSVVVDGISCSAKAKFQVERPSVTLTVVSKPASAVTIDVDAPNVGLGYGGRGQPDHGIDFSITPPAEGHTQWVQIVTTSRHRIRNANGWLHREPTHGLDTQYPYSEVDATSAWDAPKQPLASVDPFLGQYLGQGDLETDVSDSFAMHLMYRPPGDEGLDSFWVPLKVVYWGWSGTALRQGNLWEASHVTSRDRYASEPLNNTAHPTWLGNIRPKPYNEWWVQE